MLMKISWDKTNLVKQWEGGVILKVKYFAEFARGAWITTVKGATKEDYDENKHLSGKGVFVGQRGGISLD